MTPSEHYREAEKLLANARAIVDAATGTYDPLGNAAEAALAAVQQLTARATVHAALAAIPAPAGGRL